MAAASLVASNAADGQFGSNQGRIAGAELGCAVQDVAAGLPRHIEQRQQLIIPVILMNVEQAGTAGVGGVGDMHASACKPPDQKAVNGAETQFASGGTFTRAARRLSSIQDSFVAVKYGSRSSPVFW